MNTASTLARETTETSATPVFPEIGTASRETPAPLVLGDLELHPDRYAAYRMGVKVPLRKKEYELLEFLVRHKNKVMNRHTLLEYLWDYGNFAMTNTLDVHISSLRRKLDRHHDFKMLHTVYGAGYKITDEDHASSPHQIAFPF